MDKELYQMLSDLLQNQGEKILQSDIDKKVKYKKMQDIFNMKKIIDNYDDLEPTLKQYFNRKAKRDKYKREEVK